MKNPIVTSLIGTISALAMMIAAGSVQAQTGSYPSQNIRTIGPFGDGGGSDMVGRAMASVASKYANEQAFIHTNMPGANGTIAGKQVANSDPDGYTFGYLVASAAVPEIYTYFTQADYTSKDLRAVARIVVFPFGLAVPADSPFQTIDDVITHAAANPDDLVYAHAGRGEMYHLFMTTLFGKKKVQVRDLPTKGGGHVAQNLLGKHVDLGIASIAALKPHVQEGSLRVLASDLPVEIKGVDAIPTFAKAGYDLKFPSDYLAVFVPAATPDDQVQALYNILSQTVEDPSFVSMMRRMGIALRLGGPDVVEEDRARGKTVIGEALKELGMWKE